MELEDSVKLAALRLIGKAQEFCQQSILISREIGYRSQTAYQQRFLARIALSQGDPQAAEVYLQDSLAIYEELGLRGLEAESPGELSHVLVSQGDCPAAIQLAEDSLRICREQEHEAGMIEPNTVSGEAALGSGDLESPGRYFGRAIKIADDLWRPSLAHHALAGLAQLLAAQGDVEGAYRLGIIVLDNPASWQWSKDRTAAFMPQLKAELPPESVTVAPEWAEEKKLEEIIGYYLSTSTVGDLLLSSN